LITTVFVYKFPTLTREEIELMLGLDNLKQTRFYQEAQQEGLEIGRQQMLSRTVPVLLQAGLSIDQIATQLQVEVETVRQAVQPSQGKA
jgi:predicted transposase YdaD